MNALQPRRPCTCPKEHDPKNGDQNRADSQAQHRWEQQDEPPQPADPAEFGLHRELPADRLKANPRCSEQRILPRAAQAG